MEGSLINLDPDQPSKCLERRGPYVQIQPWDANRSDRNFEMIPSWLWRHSLKGSFVHWSMTNNHQSLEVIRRFNLLKTHSFSLLTRYGREQGRKMKERKIKERKNLGQNSVATPMSLSLSLFLTSDFFFPSLWKHSFSLLVWTDSRKK